MRKGELKVLEKLVAFLAKRDGIDKLIKTFQYVFKLLHWRLLREDRPDLAARAQKFEISCGLSRKAFRTGRFLTALQLLRSSSFDDPKARLLTVTGSGGEMVYFLFDHLSWMGKVGLLDSKVAVKSAYVSAFGELFLYAAFIILDLIMLQREQKKEQQLEAMKTRLENVLVKGRAAEGAMACGSLSSLTPWKVSSLHLRQAAASSATQLPNEGRGVDMGKKPVAEDERQMWTAPADEVTDKFCDDGSTLLALIQEDVGRISGALVALHRQRVMRLMSIAANAADFIIAFATVEPNELCCHPVTLGVCGLTSAWAGWYKLWPSS